MAETLLPACRNAMASRAEVGHHNVALRNMLGWGNSSNRSPSFATGIAVRNNLFYNLFDAESYECITDFIYKLAIESNDLTWLARICFQICLEG